MLIRRAEINLTTLADVRCENGVIAAIGKDISPRTNELVIDAHGAALLPSLHDHHLHFLALAAAIDSVSCSPPQVNGEDELIAVLRKKADELRDRPAAWLRGVGYHPQVAGDIDRHWLDQQLAQIPVRIQHRSGRLWIFNSRGLHMLGDLSDSPLERIDGELTGRLYDGDSWLRQRLGAVTPDVSAASTLLASYGITSFTDATPGNSVATALLFEQWQLDKRLLQDVTLMGDASLDGMLTSEYLRRGAHKIHLHESRLPDLDCLCDLIRTSHALARPIAIHCVTLTELVFVLSAFAGAGTMEGDRIEHASISPPDLLQQLVDLKLQVVTQPHFIFERGDRYLRDVDRLDIPWLYRLKGFISAQIPLAAGTDAPFGAPNPWQAMQAAVTRLTRQGQIIGHAEALKPDEAFSLFSRKALDSQLPGATSHSFAINAKADLILLDRPWREARRNLSDVMIVNTIKNGNVIWSRGLP